MSEPACISKRYHMGASNSEEPTMSDPRQFERDPNLRRDTYGNRQSGRTDDSGWIVGVIVCIILLVLIAYSVQRTDETASNPPPPSSGQTTRAPEPATPPS